jgi:hypothetical protein
VPLRILPDLLQELPNLVDYSFQRTGDTGRLLSSKRVIFTTREYLHFDKEEIESLANKKGIHLCKEVSLPRPSEDTVTETDIDILMSNLKTVGKLRIALGSQPISDTHLACLKQLKKFLLISAS